MLLFWGAQRGRRGLVMGCVGGVRRGGGEGGVGGFGTAEDHKSRKGLGAVSYRHA